MRFLSNDISSRAAEPSVLSIIETLLAMMASIWIGMHFGSWWHILVGAAMAPLLLMRTDESCKVGIQSFDSVGVYLNPRWERIERSTFVDKLQNRSPYIRLLFATFVVFGCSIGFVFIAIASRVCAFMISVATSPGKSIAAIPGNWWRLALATDVFTSPEILPEPLNEGFPATKMALPTDFRVYHMFSKMPKEPFADPFECIELIAAFTVIAPVAFAYRISVKSTALVWFPLLWALKPLKSTHTSWAQYLAVESRLKAPQLIAFWSTTCLVLLGAKYVLWLSRYELASSTDGLRTTLEQWGWGSAPGLIEWAIAIIRPGSVPRWQIATAINSILGLYIWAMMRRWHVEFEIGHGPTDEHVDRVFAITFFIRRLLTTYVVLCNGYFVLRMAQKLPILPIGPEFFPWL